MNEEIEALYALLGVKPDEASVSDSVDKLVKAVQSKLKSSVYGGKNGVITLPATIEGKFKNGKEINQDIKDAYAAIYEQAKKMADESVSLTLDDIKKFKAQIDKFGQKTAKYKGSDVIANANNNLRQTLSDYQDFVNNLRKEVSAQQKAQVKQAQKTKAQQKAKTKKSYSGVTDEEIDDAIAKENARQAKIKAWRDKQAEQLSSKLGYKTNSGIDAGKTNSYSMNASEFSEYESQWARELAKTIKETYKTTVDKQWIDKEYKPKTGSKSRATSREEHLNFLSNAAFKDLADLIAKAEKGDEDVTFDKIVEAIGVMRTIYEENGKDMTTIAQAITNATQSRYDDNAKRKNGGVNREEGTEKGVGKGHEKTLVYQASIQQLLKKMLGEVGTIKQKEVEANNTATKMTNKFEQYKAEAKQSTASKDTKALAQEIKGEKSRDEKSYIQDIRESSREATADTAEGQKNQAMLDIEKQDVDTGFNTTSKADELIDAVRQQPKGQADFPAEQVKNVLSNLGQAKQTDGKCPCQAILEGIRDAVQSINSKIQGKIGTAPTKHYVKKKGGSSEGGDTGNNAIHLMSEEMKRMPAVLQNALAKTGPKAMQTTMSKALVPIANTEKTLKDVINGVTKTDLNNRRLTALNERTEKMAEARNKNKRASGETTENVIVPNAPKMKETQQQITKAFADVIKNAFSSGSAVDKIMAATAEEQAKMRAERIKQYGLNKGRDLTDTGDVAQIRRTKELFGWNYKSDKQNKNLFQDVQLTPHIDVDEKSIMASLNKVLSGSEMFKAQTGGVWRNILGSMTGYIGMPSLEKSRAEAEGLNQVMANVRNEVMKLLQEIKSKEFTLHGMEENGEASFTSDGRITEGSSSASKKLFADLEEQKGVLRGVLAEVSMVDQVVGQTGGKVHDIIKNLGFVMPELMQNNTILQNINAGLDKSGKALKFQTRTAEVLNYTFQLMARHIGQMIKNWIMMLNPLSLIKRAFQDFASYDVKWQRTMNVIKYNLRRIVKPMMEWIAQQLVNIIGLVNAIMKGIGKVFNKNWDLFDQSAASAEQMREELEQAANVTAGFDELHDIGTESSNNPAMDLMGDIYTPQWEGLYEMLEKVGELIGNIIKAVSGWTFWDWLKLIGAALVGYLALKWLLSLFGKGKNPLQSVADGLNFLCKAVGWALLIWAFTEFTKALTDFVECMKTADWDDIAKALIMLGGAFALLFAGITGVQGMTKWLGVTTGELFGMSALVGVFALFVKAIVPFIECIKDLGDEKIEVISASLMTLAGAFIALIGGVAGVEGITKFIGIMGTELFGLAAVVGALDLFVLAIVPFIKAISEIEGNKWDTIIPMITGLVGAFIALATGVGVISRAFSTMDWKAIGQLYAVAGVFEVFMLALVPFLHAIKDLDFSTLAGGTLLIAGAFLALGGALALLTPFLKMLDWSSLLQFVIIMGVMAGLIWVLQAFVNALKDLSTEQIYAGLILLAGGLMAITVAVGALLIILTAAIASGVGALAILALAGVLAVVALVIVALAELVRALGEAGEGIKKICEGIEGVIRAIGEVIMGIITAVAEGIATVVTAIAEGITNILTPILEFIDSVIGKITELATTIVHEIGETIRSVIQTTGEVIVGIIDSLVSAIPKLLDAILRFIREIGPAVETSCDAIMRTITKLINFVVSGIEYLVNTLVIDAINGAISTITLGVFSNVFHHIEIARFVPKYEQGTNYVPNDGLAYLHQGEAVVPKKYNTPYQSDNSGMSNAINRLVQQVEVLSNKVDQGIPVKGQFVQRGSDLVATVERANNRMKNNVLNNKVYAR